MTEQQPKRPRAMVFLTEDEMLIGEISMTLFKIEDCAVPLLRITEKEGGQLLLPFTSIKYMRLLEGFEE